MTDTRLLASWSDVELDEKLWEIETYGESYALRCDLREEIAKRASCQPTAEPGAGEG